MFVAYDKNCEVWLEANAIMFVEVTPEEWKEIKDDEDRLWKSPYEKTSYMKDRRKFEVRSDGLIFHYQLKRR